MEGLVRENPELFEGLKFTQSSKQQLMEGLAVAIQRREIHFPHEGPLIRELEMFEYEYTRTGVRYSAPEGAHDDCVVALALAVSKWQGQRALGEEFEFEFDLEEVGGFVL